MTLPMQGPASALAVLGLAPGADRATIEQAYRRLIKQYHPDRSGGDAAKAAEITRAYRELRSAAAPLGPEPAPDPGPRHSRHAQQRLRRRRRRGRLWPPVALALAVVLLFEGERLLDAAPRWADGLGAELKPVGSGRRLGRGGSMEDPLHGKAIEDSVRQAGRLVRQGRWDDLARRSQDCHRSFRQDPALATLDRCAALDDAAVELDQRVASRERGPFSASAVTARQMTAASLLSSDYLAIEERLDRIRTTVELMLIPPPIPVRQSEPPADQLPGTDATAVDDAAAAGAVEEDEVLPSGFSAGAEAGAPAPNVHLRLSDALNFST